MISLEQVKLLETKVTRAIDYVKKVSDENARLKGKLDSYQKRIGELEVFIQSFKEEQSRIEDGILSALNRLNQFEDALESKLSEESKLSAEGTAPEERKAPEKKDVPATEKKKEPEPTEEPEPAAPEAPREPERSDIKSSEELDIF